MERSVVLKKEGVLTRCERTSSFLNNTTRFLRNEFAFKMHSFLSKFTETDVGINQILGRRSNQLRQLSPKNVSFVYNQFLMNLFLLTGFEIMEQQNGNRPVFSNKLFTLPLPL